jgi:hypothetical protein
MTTVLYKVGSINKLCNSRYVSGINECQGQYGIQNCIDCIWKIYVIHTGVQ